MPAVLGFVTGLVEEAGVLRHARLADAPGLEPFAAGGIAARAESGARALAEHGAELLVSFGVSGGLDPTLRCGDLVFAARVVTEAGEDARSEVGAGTVDALIARARAAGLRVRTGTMLGSDRAITSAADKSRLHAATGALAVDMESHGVARAAAACQRPFLVIRAVGDPADRAVPELAMSGLAADGTTHAWPVVRRLLRQPTALPAILQLARDTGAAMRSLRRLADLRTEHGHPVLETLA